jgi:hypothetical protein
MLDLLNRKETESMFESFSDMALCTLAVALLLVALLAINVSQRVSVKIQENHFGKESERPALYMACSMPDFSRITSNAFDLERVLFGDDPYVAVHLFGKERTKSDEIPRTGDGAEEEKNQHLEQRYNLPLYLFLMIAPGIDPDRGAVAGYEAILPAPAMEKRQLIYESSGDTGYGIHADRSLITQVLNTAWPVSILPPRTGENVAPRIYVESHTEPGPSGDMHSVVIGHCSYTLPGALEDGSLAWLSEFMSSSAEIVYLGEAWSDPENRTSKRIAFFEQAGFDACAEAYRDFLFPQSQVESSDPRVEVLCRMGFSEGDALQKVRWASRQKDVSATLIGGSFAEDGGKLLPPLLAFPDAWAAYVASCIAAKSEPPKWFYHEFLSALGFDRMAMELSNDVEER